MCAHKGTVLNICHLVVIISISLASFLVVETVSLIITTSGQQGLSCNIYMQFSFTNISKLPHLMTKCKMSLRVETNVISNYGTDISEDKNDEEHNDCFI
jgi:hypothetical protein